MAEPNETKATNTPKEATFEVAEIISAAGQFGTTPELMAGALHDVTGTITKADATKRLKAFLSRPVQNIE